MDEDSEKAPKGIKINFSPDRLRKFLRSREHTDTDLFSQVIRHSSEYMGALGIEDKDLEIMEREQSASRTNHAWNEYGGALLTMEVEGEDFGLLAVHTCCHPYGQFENVEGEGWRNLLFAIAKNEKFNKSAGGGTTWISSVPEEWHGKIIDTIRKSAEGDDLSSELFDFENK